MKNMNPMGYDNEKMKAVNFFITSGWPEGTAFEMVESFSKKSLNPGEIICLGALMKTMNTIYRKAAEKNKSEKVPKLSIVSDYPLFKVAVNDISPLMGRMMVLEGGKLYVEIDVTEGEFFAPIDWIEFAETNEQLAAYDRFLQELVDGTSPYLKLRDGSSFKLEDITYDNYEHYLDNIVEIEGHSKEGEF